MARLTDKGVKNAPAGRHGDGDGLQLVVSASGRRKWILRYQLAGTRRDMGLGSYPSVTLAQARIAAGDARKLIVQGIDPVQARDAAKRAEKPVPTFGEIALRVADEAKQKTTNAKVQYQWDRHLSPVFCGAIWARPVHEVTTTQITSLLRPVWRSKPEVSRKLYPAIRSVFDHARIVLRDEHGIAMPDNPARWTDLKALSWDAPPKLSRGHYTSLPYPQSPAFIYALRAQQGVSARALEFLVLTNARSNAVLAWRISIQRVCRCDNSETAAALVVHEREIRSFDPASHKSLLTNGRNEPKALLANGIAALRHAPGGMMSF